MCVHMYIVIVGYHTKSGEMVKNVYLIPINVTPEETGHKFSFAMGCNIRPGQPAESAKIIYHIIILLLPYPRERGPMGGAPYIGPRLGDGPIFEVSVSCLYAKERPVKLPTLVT